MDDEPTGREDGAGAGKNRGASVVSSEVALHRLCHAHCHKDSPVAAKPLPHSHTGLTTARETQHADAKLRVGACRGRIQKHVEFDKLCMQGGYKYIA